ncbi:MAG: hypothetical protein RLY37_969 [Verrucomicrobiota bacterium]
MFTSSKKTPTLSWVDCLSGARGLIDSLPSSLPGDGANPSLSLVKSGEAIALEPSDQGSALVNGALLRQRLEISEATTIQLPSALLVAAPADQQNFTFIRTDLWVLFDAQTGEQLGEFPPQRLLDVAQELGRATDTLACTPQGLEVGFSLSQIAPLLSPQEEAPIRPSGKALLAAEQNRGAHLCPVTR